MLHDYNFRLLTHISNSEQYKDQAPVVSDDTYLLLVFMPYACDYYIVLQEIDRSIWRMPVLLTMTSDVNIISLLIR